MPVQPCHPAETIAKLKCNYQEKNLPVTDGSRELHSLCAQLEFLLQVLLLLHLCSSLPRFPLGTAESRRDPILIIQGME